MKVAGSCSCMCSVVARGNPWSSALCEGPDENNAVINRRYYMAARRYEISLRVLKNIFRVSAVHYTLSALIKTSREISIK